mmetsp:Transcript_7355/g.30593  ORF Transcript_7355/g.30593 Transcript_7355/m.30593 type:complete len:154 (+) Transcript_7355:297-758(+)
MDPLERLSEKLSRPWGVVSHLKGVRDSDNLRAAYDKCQPEVVTASLRIGQSRPVYDAMVAIMENEAAFGALTPAQRRAVECDVRDAKLAGEVSFRNRDFPARARLETPGSRHGPTPASPFDLPPARRPARTSHKNIHEVSLVSRKMSCYFQSD